tara:strand:+ start:39599 stop:39700 length:102 start_codon:yes stop_codon:yes gene_type:complete
MALFAAGKKMTPFRKRRFANHLIASASMLGSPA